MKIEKLIAKFQECKDHAISKGGLCLSEEYKNYKNKMLWQCKYGHQWEAKWNSVKFMNSWCPICAKNKLTEIAELQNYAISKNGLLLSTEYINAHKKLSWQCSKGHRWETSWNMVKHNKCWCPECTGQARPYFEELQNHAISKNGKLLSTEYINNKSKLLWECEKGHQWEANWNGIKSRNSWCPECSSFKTENKCRELLEQKLNIRFNKIRFYYNNQKLEFDGYNEECKIAFEYHGYQHYEYPNKWHKTEKEFLEAQKRDDLKEQFAVENNIQLIIVPYIEENNLENYINNKIKEIYDFINFK